MKTDRIHREMVWQSFSSHVDELKRMQKQLQEIDSQREAIRQQIEAKKQVIEGALGLSWQEIESSTMHTSPNGTAAEPFRCGTKGTPSRKVSYKGSSVRQWALRAIAYFEDSNPQSRTDEASIRIFINAEAPDVLKNHNPNVVYNALNALKRLKLVQKRPGRGTGHNRSQYCLTAKGRHVLNQTGFSPGDKNER